MIVRSPIHAPLSPVVRPATGSDGGSSAPGIDSLDFSDADNSMYLVILLDD